jgi:hypothetical protein
MKLSPSAKFYISHAMGEIMLVVIISILRCKNSLEDFKDLFQTSLPREISEKGQILSYRDQMISD